MQFEQQEIELSRLEKIDVRSVWQHEAMSFTPWLARNENLQLLGNAIHMPLQLEAQEKWIGLFRADILAKTICPSQGKSGEQWVLIENQLDRTDHSHLGQIIAYASGLKAFTVVWIAGQFTDEHKAALDWLNEITVQGVQFFGVEIELWRIGQSDLAPRFHVVSNPNNWTRKVSSEASKVSISNFDKGRFIRQCLTENLNVRNVEIIRKAEEMGITLSPGYISDIRKAFLGENEQTEVAQ